MNAQLFEFTLLHFALLLLLLSLVAKGNFKLKVFFYQFTLAMYVCACNAAECVDVSFYYFNYALLLRNCSRECESENSYSDWQQFSVQLFY